MSTRPMRRLLLAFASLLALAGCLGNAVPTGEALEELLVGRTVLYSPGDPATGRQPLYNTWNADGTRVYDRRPLVFPDRRFQVTGVWWVENGLYCEANDARRTTPICYTVSFSPDGGSISFTQRRTDLVAMAMFPPLSWGGVFVERRS